MTATTHYYCTAEGSITLLAKEEVGDTGLIPVLWNCAKPYTPDDSWGKIGFLWALATFVRDSAKTHSDESINWATPPIKRFKKMYSGTVKATTAVKSVKQSAGTLINKKLAFAERIYVDSVSAYMIVNVNVIIVVSPEPTDTLVYHKFNNYEAEAICNLIKSENKQA